MRSTLALGLFATLVACGKKSESEQAVPNAADDIVSALSQAYPGALSISVFPTDNTAAGKALRFADSELGPENLKDKAAEAEKLLKGKADNCLPPIFLRPLKSVSESCYEFDQDMLEGSRSGNQSSFGTADGTSNIAGSSEACLVSFARTKIQEVEAIIDQGLGFQQGVICQAVKDQVDVRDASTVDGVELKDVLQEAMDAGPSNPNKPKIKVTEAKISKDDTTYRVSIKTELALGGKTITQTYSLAHVPDDATNTTYHGVLTMTRSAGGPPQLTQSAPPPGGGAGGNPGANAGTRFLSVSYTKAVDTDGANRLRAELRTAKFHKDLEDKALNEDGTVNYNAGAAADGTYTGYSNPNEAVDSMMLVAFDLNTDNNTGGFEYWQNPGGNYQEAARGMVFKLEEKADASGQKVLTGCGMSGAARTLSIRKSIKTNTAIKPDGSYHPFFFAVENGNPNPNVSCTSNTGPATCTLANNGGSWKVPTFSVAANTTAADIWARSQQSGYVTRQCVTQNEQGVYLIDTSKIADSAGYELFLASDTSKFIAKPTAPKEPPKKKPAGS